jgi:hypothetical protein
VNLSNVGTGVGGASVGREGPECSVLTGRGRRQHITNFCERA